MLSSSSPYHFSSPANYCKFVGRRTDKGMCLTFSITDNWTQYAAETSRLVIDPSRKPDFDLFGLSF